MVFVPGSASRVPCRRLLGLQLRLRQLRPAPISQSSHSGSRTSSCCSEVPSYNAPRSAPKSVPLSMETFPSCVANRASATSLRVSAAIASPAWAGGLQRQFHDGTSSLLAARARMHGDFGRSTRRVRARAREAESQLSVLKNQESRIGNQGTLATSH